MELPNVLKQWITDNSDPSYQNNSRSILTKKLTFLYTKFQHGKNEYWADQIERMTGISYDYKGTDSVGNN
jgi:hypothetical protein